MSMVSRPPRFARWLLAKCIPPGPPRDGLVGDLDELYTQRIAERGRLWADVWYVAEAVFASVRYRPRVQRWVDLVRRRRTRGPGHRAATESAPRLRDGPTFAEEMLHAARRLVRAPGFTLTVVTTLAVSLGATGAIFTVVHGVVLNPLPYPDADRLVVIEHDLPGFPVAGGPARFGAYAAQVLLYGERSTRLASLGGFGTFDASLSGDGKADYLRMGYGSAGLFPTLGVSPAIGRDFRTEEIDAGGEGLAPVVLSHGLWAERYGMDPSVVGRTMTAEGFSYEIVGVMPDAFRYPRGAPRLHRVWADNTLQRQPTWTYDAMVGRMAPGVTPEAVEAELNAIIPELPDRFPLRPIQRIVAEGHMEARVTPLLEWVVGDVATLLWILLASVGVVLVVACVNVANLVLVRADSRRQELAIRRTLGASRAAVVRYVGAESCVLVAMSAIVALCLVVIGVGSLLRIAPPNLPRLDEVAIGWEPLFLVSVLAAAAAVTLTVVRLVHDRARTMASLRDDGRGVTSGRQQLRARHALVGFQMAMTVVLLVGSGLTVRSFWALSRVDPGVRSEGVLTFQVVFPFQEIQAAVGRRPVATPFYAALADRLAAVPGVESVGFGACLPLVDDCVGGTVLQPEGATVEAGDEFPVIGVVPVSPGFLETLEVPHRSGRGLEPRDHEARTNAVVVSADLARRFWPDGNPLGRRITRGSADTLTPFTVVGVTSDVHWIALREEPMPVVYRAVLARNQTFESFTVSFVVRTSVPPLSMVETVRREVRALRADVPVTGVRTMEDIVAASTARFRFALWLLGVAAAVALALSAVGVYGVVSYVVGLRRNEFGIRIALGAGAGQVRRMVVRQGSGMALLGLAVGVGAAVGLSRFLSSLLFRVESTDLVTYGAVLAFLGVVAWLAAYVPARRASQISPSQALRT